MMGFMSFAEFARAGSKLPPATRSIAERRPKTSKQPIKVLPTRFGNSFWILLEIP